MMSHGKIALLWLLVITMATTAAGNNSALLVIDVQNCFVEGGALAVTPGALLPAIINSILQQHNFSTITYSLDSHPHDHISFASQHQNNSAFSTVKLYYDQNGTLCKPTTLKDTSRAQECSGALREVTQELWPDHCVEQTEESVLVPSLNVLNQTNVSFVYKGADRNVESYSPFYNHGNSSNSDLDDKLKLSGVKKVFLVGISTEYCVKFASLDAIELGYEVYVVKDAVAGVSEHSSEQALKFLQDKGAHIIGLQDLPGVLGS